MWQSIESGPAWARDMHVVAKIDKTHKNIHYTQTQQPPFRARENRQRTSYNFNFLQYYVQFWVLPDVGGSKDH